MMGCLKTLLLTGYFLLLLYPVFSQSNIHKIDIPDSLIIEAYERAGSQNVLAAVNPKVFFGYFSVCADGVGFGYGNTYPSLDGHQMSDALLWLEQPDVVKANWDYVKGFQKSKGELPIAILREEAGKNIGPAGYQVPVDANGGLYKHWVPGDPLRALAGTTYIQNADVIFRFTQDRKWLLQQLPSVNLTADYLASMVNKEGAVGGGGYYVERPTRLEYDGVAQCYAAVAFHTLALLNNIAGYKREAMTYKKLAELIETNFRKNFWATNHFVEYINPARGKISNHGLTDVDWSAIATGMATTEQRSILWPLLKGEKKFYYNGMPTGIASKPETYEKWETTYSDNYDLAAMGRVWYIESAARASMHDANGLIETIRRVCQAGRDSGYYWRERYNNQGGYGAKKYNEYPANLIRIIQRFLFGVEHELDGALSISPTAPDEFWTAGFGQSLSWNKRHFSYKMDRSTMKGNYTGTGVQIVAVKFPQVVITNSSTAKVNGKKITCTVKDGWISISLPASGSEHPCEFELHAN
jgi:hypothetical protein